MNALSANVLIYMCCYGTQHQPSHVYTCAGRHPDSRSTWHMAYTSNVDVEPCCCPLAMLVCQHRLCNPLDMVAHTHVLGTNWCGSLLNMYQGVHVVEMWLLPTVQLMYKLEEVWWLCAINPLGLPHVVSHI